MRVTVRRKSKIFEEMNYKKLIVTTFLASIFIGVLVFCTYFINQKSLNRFDFVAYYNGAASIVAGEARNLYGLSEKNKIAEGNSFVVYKNPPILALLFIPLTFFPLLQAYRLYVFFSLLLMLLAVKLLRKEFGDLSVYTISVFTFTFIPGIISVITGQISFMLLIIWVFILRLFKNRNYFLLGIASGLLGIKPQFLMFLPFLLLTIGKKRKFLSGVVLSLLAQLFLSVLVVGTGGIMRYPSFLANTESQLYTSDPYSQISFVSLLFNSSRKLVFLMGREYAIDLIAYVLSVVVFVLLGKRGDDERYLYVGCLLTLLFLPHLWDYDLVLVLPVFFYMVKESLNYKYDHNKKILSVIFAYTLYFSWILRFAGFPFLISSVLLVISAYLFAQKSRPQKT